MAVPGTAGRCCCGEIGTGTGGEDTGCAIQVNATESVKWSFANRSFFFSTVCSFGGAMCFEKEKSNYYSEFFSFFFSLPFLQALSLALLWLFRKSEWVEWFGKRCLGGPRIIDTQETTVKIDMLFGYQNMMCVASIYH
jgi:hypothetical protein